MRCFQNHIHALIDVANKHHGSIGIFLFLAPGKRPGRHVILHDLHTVLVLELDASHFIECHAVPHANQSYRFIAHIVKQVCYCSLSAGNQNAVRTDFLIDMGFAGTARAKLAEVIVVFNQWDHARQMQPFHPFIKLGWLHACASQYQIDPLFIGEIRPNSLDFIDIKPRHLYGCQFANDKRTAFIGFIIKVFHLDNAPYTAAKQAFIIRNIVCGNRHPF